MKLKQELRALQKKWKKSKARSVQEPVPDGKYEMKVIDCRIERAKKSSRLQIVWVIQILTGKYKKRIIYRYDGLETENNLGFLKADFKKLGFKLPKNIMKITKIVDDIAGMSFHGQVKTNGEYTNIYINDVIDEEDEEDEDEDDEDDVEDEVELDEDEEEDEDDE